MGFMFEYPLLFFFQKSFLPKWEGWLDVWLEDRMYEVSGAKMMKNGVLSIRL